MARKISPAEKMHLVITVNSGYDLLCWLITDEQGELLSESDSPEEQFLEMEENENLQAFSTVVELYEYTMKHNIKVVDEHHILT